MENTTNRRHAGEAFRIDNREGFEQTDLHNTLYETPHVISYTDDDILDELGPAQTITYDNRQPL